MTMNAIITVIIPLFVLVSTVAAATATSSSSSSAAAEVGKNSTFAFESIPNNNNDHFIGSNNGMNGFFGTLFSLDSDTGLSLFATLCGVAQMFLSIYLAATYPSHSILRNTAAATATTTTSAPNGTTNSTTTTTSTAARRRVATTATATATSKQGGTSDPNSSQKTTTTTTSSSSAASSTTTTTRTVSVECLSSIKKIFACLMCYICSLIYSVSITHSLFDLYMSQVDKWDWIILRTILMFIGFEVFAVLHTAACCYYFCYHYDYDHGGGGSGGVTAAAAAPSTSTTTSASSSRAAEAGATSSATTRASNTIINTTITETTWRTIFFTFYTGATCMGLYYKGLGLYKEQYDYYGPMRVTNVTLPKLTQLYLFPDNDIDEYGEYYSSCFERYRSDHPPLQSTKHRYYSSYTLDAFDFIVPTLTIEWGNSWGCRDPLYKDKWNKNWPSFNKCIQLICEEEQEQGGDYEDEDEDEEDKQSLSPQKDNSSHLNHHGDHHSSGSTTATTAPFFWSSPNPNGQCRCHRDVSAAKEASWMCLQEYIENISALFPPTGAITTATTTGDSIGHAYSPIGMDNSRSNKMNNNHDEDEQQQQYHEALKRQFDHEQPPWEDPSWPALVRYGSCDNTTTTGLSMDPNYINKRFQGAEHMYDIGRLFLSISLVLLFWRCRKSCLQLCSSCCCCIMRLFGCGCNDHNINSSNPEELDPSSESTTVWNTLQKARHDRPNQKDLLVIGEKIEERDDETGGDKEDFQQKQKIDDDILFEEQEEEIELLRTPYGGYEG